MKPILRHLLLLLIITTLSLKVSVQNQILAMSVEAIGQDTTADGLLVVNPTTSFSATMNITLDNTDLINKVHVTLGSTPSGSEYMSTSFDYNTQGTFGATSYSQTGNNIQLGLGSFVGMEHYYASVWLEHTDLSTSTPLNFSR
ncbi:hypothetical protein BH11BAC1_BH11BAC1_06600 [soil metagenome]